MNPIFIPNETVPVSTKRTIAASLILIWLAAWTALRYPIFPSPLDVLQALPHLWLTEGLGDQLIRSSLVVNLEALALSILIALPLAYLSRVPAVGPLAYGLSKLRFLSPAVFFLLLLFIANNGHQVKVLMLTAGEVFFLLMSAITIVQAVPNAALDDARTLRMNEWEVTWYVVVRGTLADMLKAIRDNAAMAWASLMMIEGIVRSEGGVGVMLLNQEKHMNFAEVYAIAGAIIIIGIVQDYALGALRRGVCPYAD